MNYNSNKFWCDGGFRKGVGYGSYSDGVESLSIHFPDAKTSNEAEFDILARLLLVLTGYKPRATIYMDSALVVNSLTKGWKIKAKNLIPKHTLCQDLLQTLDVELKWVSRKVTVKVLGH